MAITSCGYKYRVLSQEEVIAKIGSLVRSKPGGEDVSWNRIISRCYSGRLISPDGCHLIDTMGEFCIDETQLYIAKWMVKEVSHIIRRWPQLNRYYPDVIQVDEKWRRQQTKKLYNSIRPSMVS